MAWVRGIQRMERLQPHTEAQGGVGWLTAPQGLGNIPVLSLATLLQRPNAADRRQGKILLLKTQPQPYGLLVERLESAIQVDPQAVFPLPTVVRNPARDYFAGVIKHEEKMMLALSPESLCPGVEMQELRSLASSHALDTLYAVAGLATTPRGRKKILLFSTTPEASLTFGLSLSQVPQVLRPLPLLPVPGAAASVLGLAEWRGVPLPVIDLPRRLGGDASPGIADGRLLVVRAPTTRACVGLPIHPQISIHDLPLAHRPSTEPVPLQETLLRGKFALPQTTLVIPDIDSLLSVDNSCPA
jgi:purine-binding chemotaxis protein CheW